MCIVILPKTPVGDWQQAEIDMAQRRMRKSRGEFKLIPILIDGGPKDFEETLLGDRQALEVKTTVGKMITTEGLSLIRSAVTKSLGPKPGPSQHTATSNADISISETPSATSSTSNFIIQLMIILIVMALILLVYVVTIV